MPSARKKSPAKQANSKALLAEPTPAATPAELSRPSLSRRRASSSGSLSKGYDSRGSEVG
jgi:hypothetical protein